MLERCPKKWSLVVLGLALSSLSVEAIPSRRAYLAVREQLAAQLSRQFSVPIERGIYYTNPWEAKLIPALRTSQFEEEVLDVDLSYLSQDSQLGDSTIRKLYRGELWQGSESDFKARVGWVTNTLPNGKSMVQLWLEKTDKQRWLLYQYERGNFKTSGSTPSRLINIPQYFFPERNGLVAFTSNWHLWYKGNTEKILNKFDVQRGGQSRSQVELKIHTIEEVDSNGETYRVPLVSYSPDQNKMLIAAWPFLPLSEEDAPTPNEFDIYSFDFKTKRATLVKDNVAWPFLLTRDGVWTETFDLVRQEKVLKYQPLNWGNLKLGDGVIAHRYPESEGSSVFDSKRFYFEEAKSGKRWLYTEQPSRVELVERGKKFLTLEQIPKEDKRVFDGLVKRSNELLLPLRRGVDEPIIFDQAANEQISSILGAERRTWANVIYNDGAWPHQIIRSYLWGNRTGAQESAPNVYNVESAFHFKSDELFAGQTEPQIRATAKKLIKVIESSRTILYLEDFPTADPAAALSTASQQRLLVMSEVFNLCLVNTGTCRLITTTRSEVFAALRDKVPAPFDKMRSFALSEPNPRLRYQFARMIAMKFESERGLSIDTRAFTRVMNFIDRKRQDEIAQRGRGKVKAFPEYESLFLADFFDKVKEQGYRQSNENVVAINLDLVNKTLGRSIVGNDGYLQPTVDFLKLKDFLKRNVAGRIHRELIDQIVSSLEAQTSGYRPETEGPPAFLVLGSSGVGKTYIPSLISRYFLANGDEKAALLLSDDDILLFDLKYDPSKQFKIEPNSKQAAAIRAAGNGQPLIVTFDEVQAAETGSINSVIQVMDKGYYARNRTDDKGAQEQLNFNRVGAVFFTSTWGANLIQEGKLGTPEFETELQDFLLQSDKGPKLDEGTWGRISQNIYILPDLRLWELMEVGLIATHQLALGYQDNLSKEILVDPLVINRLAESAAKKGQGRYVAKGVINAVTKNASTISREGVSQVLISLGPGGGLNNNFTAKTAGDEGFEERWKIVSEVYSGYQNEGIDSYLEFLKENYTGKYSTLREEKAKDDEVGSQ